MDAVDWRGLQQVLIVVLAGLTTFLGYRLYGQGLTAGDVRADVKSGVWGFTIIGTGPGLLFMVLGSIVMFMGVHRGDAVAGDEVLGRNVANVLANLPPSDRFSAAEKKILEASSAVDREPLTYAIDELRTEYLGVIVDELETNAGPLAEVQAASDPRTDTLPLIEERPADARSLDLNTIISDSFGAYADRWYEVRLATDTTYSFLTLPPAQGQSVDTRIFLYSSHGEVGQDDDCGLGTHSYLAEDLTSDIYYLRVNSYYGIRGEYQVVAYEGEPSREKNECDSSLGNDVLVTDTIRSGDTVTGVFEVGSTSNYYVLRITDPGHYRIETSQAPGENEVDTVIELYRGAARTLLGYDDDGGSRPFSLLLEELAQEDYYVAVSSFWDSPGTYTLRVARTEEEPQ